MTIYSPQSRPEHPHLNNDPVPARRRRIREKAAGVLRWLILDSTGQTQVVEEGKHAIMRRTGLPARDLRILDPMLSYPSVVLGRERAIVINLVHIKVIITAQEVLLLNSRDPSVLPFVEELKRRILWHYQASKSQDGNGDGSNWKNMYDSGTPSRTCSPPDFGRGISPSEEIHEENKADGKQGRENLDGSKVLPFEFVALEACLEAACSYLENEVKKLEREAYPAIDILLSKINTLNLERVRQIKSRLVENSKLVQQVRDGLEHLLDDDESMAEMYLTDRLNLENLSTSSINEKDDVNLNDVVLRANIDERIPAEISLQAPEASTSTNEVDLQWNLPTAHDVINKDSHGTHTSKRINKTSYPNYDIVEVEMILEAYFVQINSTLNKLSMLKEYANDTGDYVNLMLDEKQNNLLRMGVRLATAGFMICAFMVVVDTFGINIDIEMFDDQKSGMPEFLWTIAGGTVGCVFLYVAAIAWFKSKHWLQR